MRFQTRSRVFLARHGLSHTPQIHTLDLISEIGEIAKALLEASDYDESPPRRTLALAEELGDAFFSLIALAESLDVDLETALEKVLAKYESRLAEQGLPLLVGLSRKSLVGQLIGREVEERLPASLALAVLAVERGATIVRTHDVAATADAVAMWTALVELGGK